jgi:cytochrome c-type biogenesis protein CcmH
VSEEISDLLKAALEIDPQQQKGLWLLGMAAAQNGDDEIAVALWQQLQQQFDPASGPGQAIAQQIEMAQKRLGTSPAPNSVPNTAPSPPAQSAVAGVQIPVKLELDSGMAQNLPPGAVLFVFVHPSGGAGMPLAVKRISAPAFPLSLTLSDADTLRPDTSLADFEQLDISARVSLTGVANASAGDYQAERITLDTSAVTEIALNLGQGVR